MTTVETNCPRCNGKGYHVTPDPYWPGDDVCDPCTRCGGSGVSEEDVD